MNDESVTPTRCVAGRRANASRVNRRDPSYANPGFAARSKGEGADRLPKANAGGAPRPLLRNPPGRRQDIVLVAALEART